MKKSIYLLLLLNITLMSTNVFATDKNEGVWLNDLDCAKFTEEKTCKELYSALENVKLSDYEKMTFDNQLKKISFLIRKDKENIATKRYEYLLKSLSKSIDKSSYKMIEKNKIGLWDLIKNYSLSEYYESNPKYKL